MAYPQFQAPEWQTQRISALRQQLAAPQVGRLKRQMPSWMSMGYDPQSLQGRRATVRGYGEGLGGIMAGAGQLALSQYGQEYGTQMRAAELGFGAEMEEEKTARAEAETQRRRGWETGERTGAEEAAATTAKLLAGWRTGERVGEEAWRTGERTGAEEAAASETALGRTWRTGEAAAQREWQAGQTRYEYTGSTRGRGARAFKGMPTTSFSLRRRQQGGPVRPPIYSVGEGGTSSRPKPELVVYKGGRMELVGKKGPELRTFPEKGQVIPAGKTKRILKRQRGGWVSGPEQEKLRRQVQSAKYRLQLRNIRSAEPGRRTQPASPFSREIMSYLKSTRMDPSGAGHMPRWQFMLKTQPNRLFSLLSSLQGEGRQRRR